MINDHATVTDGVTREAVPSSSHRDEEAMRPGETHRGPDVRHPGATHNQRRVSVDRSVPYTSVLVVPPIAGTDELTAQRRHEFVDGALVKRNLVRPGQRGHAPSVDLRRRLCQELQFHSCPGTSRAGSKITM